jgi:hypothetical protein
MATIRFSLGNRFALGLGALCLRRCPCCGVFSILCSAVGSHRANLSAISRAIGTFGIVGDFPTAMPVYHFNLMAGVPRLLDPRGTYLPDDDAARRHGEQLVRRQLVQGLKWSVEVISENGGVVDIVEPPGRNPTL